MSHVIIIDEPAVMECVESNLYQSKYFEAGNNLLNAVSGDKSVAHISSRLVPTWKRETLFLLQSRVEAGYLLIDSSIFEKLPSGAPIDDRLLLIQRICRFALKTWKGLNLSQSEKWSPKTKFGVIFPYPISKQTGFRITLSKGIEERRVSVRHGSKQLFAFAAGNSEATTPSAEQLRLCKRALEDLTGVRSSLDITIRKIESIPTDNGSHPLILNDTTHNHIKFQSFEKWMERLTLSQKAFVTSNTEKPQRVEGPAGTGKTLCLLLRAFYLCQDAAKDGREFKILFVAHSEATRQALEITFDVLGEPFYHRKPSESPQSIALHTLQEWCGKVLGTTEIANSQYLDQDALQAKELRRDIIKTIIDERLKEDVKSLEYLSNDCKAFFESENSEYIAELLQHEIGVMIKGRASESLESYLELPHLAYCLPTSTPNDKRFVFSLYTEYQKQLTQSGLYDTDDIVLSTLGRLNTPIWRRRRLTEGFDAVIIDETHLFNFNELSVFHYFVRDIQKPRIIFSIDRSQAPGERGITTKLVREVLTQSTAEEIATKTNIVFRCSPAIVKLAEAVTATGTMLFVTFENPLVDALSIAPAGEAETMHEPVYWKCLNEAEMCLFAIDRAKQLCGELKCRPSDVLLVATTEELISPLSEALANQGKRFVKVLQRGDLETVQKGVKEGAYIVSHPDYVGGLEFQAVFIIGVDEGRMPPSEGIVKDESKHFVEFKACNRLYVSISRARFAVELFYSAERGPSPLLDNARSTNALVVKEAS